MERRRREEDRRRDEDRDRRRRRDRNHHHRDEGSKRRRYRSPDRRRRSDDHYGISPRERSRIEKKAPSSKKLDEVAVEEDEEEEIDEAELAGFGDEEDDEEVEARRAAERRAKREVAKHRCKEKEFEEEVVEATSPAAAPSEAVVEPIKYKQTSLGLAEERKESATFDMFGEDEPSEVVENPHLARRATAAQLAEEQTNWDDGEGYYMARPGEMIDDRYRVLGVVGRGVFSSVLRAKDHEAGERLVAVKMIRNNETMTKAAVKEIQILHEIAAKDPDDKCHCVRLLSSTQHRNHTALVFESMAMNLREVLRKYGKNVGINIIAVRAYARQLFAALRHLRKTQIVHADIKPDNILVSDNNSIVKVCDFGSAFRESDPADPAPYLVSRFYRAPEIILGLKYDARIDLWSVATCLFELYAGRVMFVGVNNNQMLAKMMDLKGRFPVKMLKAHVRVYRDLLVLDPHFQDLDGTFKFQQRTVDERTNEARLTFVDILKPKTTISQLFLAKKAGADDHKAVLDLADLLEQCSALNPDNRPLISDCIKHRFIAPPPAPKPASAAPAASSSSAHQSRMPAETTSRI
ncbi:hypothetical protein CTAYLR_008544 [Chrysophaeum taylorii]|uniref:non-specific serine/threonine protein kinase n=1 Tax=Chrysophaeum taylorii TaxID=2483200 RepID=A0AAD7XF07_9STRA|nr:hypothetical protein CTAYLR_008544 [Chrysophaeum taylorii]